jgi:hypothetical protein
MELHGEEWFLAVGNTFVRAIVGIQES